MAKQRTVESVLLSRYAKTKDLPGGKFRRLTGVCPRVFATMLAVLRRAEKKKRKAGGSQPRLILEDRLLMALEYLREYRTYFHLSQSYGLSESSAFKICRWVEDTLVKDRAFALPGRKALLGSAARYEVVLIDASESPVQRPKKDRGTSTPARRSATPSRAR
jgi:hypothetical protein